MRQPLTQLKTAMFRVFHEWTGKPPRNSVFAPAKRDYTPGVYGVYDVTPFINGFAERGFFFVPPLKRV